MFPVQVLQFNADLVKKVRPLLFSWLDESFSPASIHAAFLSYQPEVKMDCMEKETQSIGELFLGMCQGKEAAEIVEKIVGEFMFKKAHQFLGKYQESETQTVPKLNSTNGVPSVGSNKKKNPQSGFLCGDQKASLSHGRDLKKKKGPSEEILAGVDLREMLNKKRQKLEETPSLHPSSARNHPLKPSHTSASLCVSFPFCTFGASCKFTHPPIPCKFAGACQNPQCNYLHSETAPQNSATLCRFYPRCMKGPKCIYLHPKPQPSLCRFGFYCKKRSTCPHLHPASSDPSKQLHISERPFSLEETAAGSLIEMNQSEDGHNYQHLHNSYSEDDVDISLGNPESPSLPQPPATSTSSFGESLCVENSH